jgi:hypothetical protein
VRRFATFTATVVVLLMLGAPAALAASAAVTEPSDTVREPVELRVTVTKDSRVEPVSRVRVRMQHRGEHVGERIDLECKQRCGDDHTEQVWGPQGDRKLDPATGAPFDAQGPLANGEYELEIRVDRGRFLEPIETTDRIRLAVPPSAPREVTAERDGDEVTVTWRRAPEPDVTGYRVERRDGENWADLATTPDDRHVDEPGPGTHAYRVVALRDDGRGGTLEKASSTAEVEVPAPGDDGNGNGNGGGSNGNGEGNGNGGDTDGNGNGNGNGDSDGEGNGEGNGNGGDGDGDAEEASGSSSSERTRRSSSPARAPSLGSDGSGSIPSVFGRDPASADPDAFSEELDFGDPRNGNGDGDDDVVLSSGRGGTMERLMDAERVATPIAVGLVLTATGLHLWRWMRVPTL